MLQQRRILIVEDDGLVACDLAAAVEAASGDVLGPFASIKSCLAGLAGHEVDGAILDVRLPDGQISPVARALLDCGTPVVFHSGMGLPADLAASYGGLTVCEKPALPERVVRQLANLMGLCA
ncbi:MAG: response regulator [Caulobacteraceae bacterium]